MSSRDAIRSTPGDRKPIRRRRLAATLIGLVLLVGIVVVAPKAWAVLVVAVPAAWSWYLDQNITPGHGTIIGGTFVCVAAIIAYTGTHLSRRSTERIADNNNSLADLQELRRRFGTTTAQFADPSPEIRLAGVYALEALTDDWIDRGKYTDAQTCINYLCGYLTRPYTPPTDHPHLRQTVVTPDAATHIERTYNHPHDDLTVRQAITRTIATHTKPDHHHNWSKYDYDLTSAYFHSPDFTGSHFRGTVNFSSAQFYGEQTSFDNVQFRGALTTFYGAQFHGEATSFRAAKFRGDRTSFFEAKFYSKKLTSFSGASFRSDLTSFYGAQFHGETTSFDNVRFRDDLTSFDAALFSSKETSFVGAWFRSDLTSFSAAKFDSEQTLFDWTWFRDDRTSFCAAKFSGDRTSFGGALFCSKETLFDAALFSSKETSFIGAWFLRGGRTWFGRFSLFRSGNLMSFAQTQFRGDRTSFYEAKFDSNNVTSFESPGAWNNVYFDWDTEVPYAVKGDAKPDTVRPHDWPPTVVEPTP